MKESVEQTKHLTCRYTKIFITDGIFQMRKCKVDHYIDPLYVIFQLVNDLFSSFNYIFFFIYNYHYIVVDFINFFLFRE